MCAPGRLDPSSALPPCGPGANCWMLYASVSATVKQRFYLYLIPRVVKGLTKLE